MLRISTAQVEGLRALTRARFEATMMARCQALAPGLCATLDAAQLRVVVRTAITRAAAHGFTFTGPVRLFVELSVLLGCCFDDDPLHPFARACLLDDGAQMPRAEALHAQAVAALRPIDGPRRLHHDAALRRLRAHLASPPPDEPAEPAETLLRRLHPQKFARALAPALRALIAGAHTEAAWHGLHAAQDPPLLLALMFTLGHGCLEDPLLPWAAASLAPGPEPRAALLRARALAWLDQVLADRDLPG